MAMEDKPISVRLGVRRTLALERYLAAHPDEKRNGVIAGAVEQYLRDTGYWQDAPDGPERAPNDRRPTLSERVKRLEEVVEKLAR
jgi:hypothetical protein